MTVAPYQVVRLARGRHASPAAGVCAMELASMVAHEPFSDRSPTISPTIGAFLRTYNDGLTDDRRQAPYAVAALIVGSARGRAVERQQLYAVAALIVGSARGRAVEPQRTDACLNVALERGMGLPSPRVCLAMA